MMIEYFCIFLDELTIPELVATRRAIYPHQSFHYIYTYYVYIVDQKAYGDLLISTRLLPV